MAYDYSLESRMSRAAMKSLGTNPKLFPGIFRKIFTIVGAIAESINPFSSVDLVLSTLANMFSVTTCPGVVSAADPEISVSRSNS